MAEKVIRVFRGLNEVSDPSFSGENEIFHTLAQNADFSTGKIKPCDASYVSGIIWGEDADVLNLALTTYEEYGYYGLPRYLTFCRTRQWVGDHLYFYAEYERKLHQIHRYEGQSDPFFL